MDVEDIEKTYEVDNMKVDKLHIFGVFMFYTTVDLTPSCFSLNDNFPEDYEAFVIGKIIVKTLLINLSCIFSGFSANSENSSKITSISINSNEICSQNTPNNDLKICINSTKLSVEFCSVGCGLFIIQNNQYHLIGISNQSTDFLLINKQKEVINWMVMYSKNPASQHPVVIYNSTQKLRKHHHLLGGECMKTGEDIISVGKCFALSFRSDGNLLIIQVSTSIVVWHSNTRGKFGKLLCLNRNGDILMKNAKNQTVWRRDSGFSITKNIINGVMAADATFLSQNDQTYIILFGINLHCLN